MPNYRVSHPDDRKLHHTYPSSDHPPTPHAYPDRTQLQDIPSRFSSNFDHHIPLESPTGNLAHSPGEYFIPNTQPSFAELSSRHVINMSTQSLPADPIQPPHWEVNDSFFPDVPDTHDFYLSSDLANPSLESINESVTHNPFASYDQFFPPPPIRTDFIAPYTPTFSDGVSDYSDTSEGSRYVQRNKSTSSISVSPSSSKITKKPSFNRKPSIHRLPKAETGISPLINSYVNLDLNSGVRSDSSTSSRSEERPMSRKSSKMSLTEAAAAAAAAAPKKHTRRKLNPRSRNGCWICRIKHVKCNEERPICHGCKKYNLECDYSAEKPAYVTDKNLRQEKLQQIARPRNRSSEKKK